MFARIIITTLLCLFIALASACGKSQPTDGNGLSASRPAQPTPQTAEKPRQERPQVPPPSSTAELEEVVRRIYQDAVILDEGRRDAFLVGDFNGDNSQDIAVVVKPGKGRLSQLNSGYANWTLEDPLTVRLTDVRNGTQRSPEKAAPVRVRQDDNLLAVIHGLQETGWRNPKATQTYLLKNAVGDEMERQRARSLLSASMEKEPLPPLRGDVIRQTLSGTSGFIYWTGAKYAWHSAAQHD